MTPIASPVPHPTTVDEDLAEQALPGHGIPSQDPNAAAQVALEPEDAKRESSSVLTGGGVVVGLATGAALGVALAGPIGVVVGAAVGAVVGALGGAAVGETVKPEDLAVDAQAVVPGVHLHIEDSGGAGRPVVLIHGWPLSAQAWESQVSVLHAAGYRVVTYDRRGFGRSDKSASDYGYDTLVDDLQRVLDQCGLEDVTLVGFSMGGGEAARFVSRCGESRLHSLVFAAAVTPYLMNTTDNPEGPHAPEAARQSRQALEQDRTAFFDQFSRDFFSANGTMLVTEPQRLDAVALCKQSAPHAALACMDAFSTTDFRADLKKITVPTLVLHGDADAVVPIEGSGQRTHRAVPHSQLVRVAGAPHGLNVTHAQAFNDALLAFLRSCGHEHHA